MARKKNMPDKNGFVLFDVIYEDGSRSSNRKVPNDELEGFDGDKPARSIIEAQDRLIAERGGVERGRVKTIERSARQ
jgi:hypothetical protein